jgi:hypothetical protein
MNRVLASCAAIATPILLAGCHIVQGEEERLSSAKAAIIKAAADDEGMANEPQISNLRASRAEGDSLLGTYCGNISDRDMREAGEMPRRFIYMAIDKDVVFETVRNDFLPPSSAEERKLLDDVIKAFDDLWNDGCDEAAQ